MKVRPHVGTALAAHSADETRLEIGQPRVVRHRSALIAIEWLQW